MSEAPTRAEDHDDHVRRSLSGRPVLVTGADGFVGSHLCEELVALGAHVHVLVRATSSGLLHNIGHLQDQIVVHRCDLTDKHAVSAALAALKSDGGQPIIFHLGAQAHVGESWNRPYETVATNVLGTIHLLESIVDLGLDLFRIDVAGSSEEYGNIREELKERYRFDAGGGLILDERSPLNPKSVYATSKVATDFLTRNFHSAYGVPAVITRMFNNYGPRQSPRFITGTVISQALSRDVVKLGYVRSKRDFCFVKDGARGHIHATLFGTPGEIYVFGYGQTISISDWCGLILRLGREMGYWPERLVDADTAGRARLGDSEVEELRVDYTKLNRTSGWTPSYSWDAGLRDTIDWFVAHRDSWIRRVDWK